MLLGKVVGTLVATRKDEKLSGFRFLVVRQLNVENQETGDYVIAADAVQAGVGDVVLYATGSSARQTVLSVNWGQLSRTDCYRQKGEPILLNNFWVEVAPILNLFRMEVL